MKARNWALSLWLKLTVAYRRQPNIVSRLPLFARTFVVSLPTVFRTAFIFVRRNIALLSWLYFMTAEILQFCRLGLDFRAQACPSRLKQPFAAIKHF